MRVQVPLSPPSILYREKVNKMKVLMVGTPHCIKCRQIAPRLEDYCKEHYIEYDHINLNDAPQDIVELLMSKKVTSAPAFIIYRGEGIVIVTGEDVFLELESSN